MAWGSREGSSPLCKTKNQQAEFESTENAPCTLKKHLRSGVRTSEHKAGLLSFKRAPTPRAPGVTGTKRALTSLVTDTDGQFCCFQSQGTRVEDAGTDSISLQTVFTSATHFPSLDSMPSFFLYLFIPFILSVWPLMAPISLGLGLIGAREWISNAACSQCFSHLMGSRGKSGQPNSELSQSCISQAETPCTGQCAEDPECIIQRQSRASRRERGLQSQTPRFLSRACSHQQGDIGHVH